MFNFNEEKITSSAVFAFRSAFSFSTQTWYNCHLHKLVLKSLLVAIEIAQYRSTFTVHIFGLLSEYSMMC